MGVGKGVAEMRALNLQPLSHSQSKEAGEMAVAMIIVNDSN